MTEAWARVAKLAERQHGVFARWQLRSIGVNPRVLQGWCSAGRIFRVHRGVFAVGRAALSPEGRWLAAVLAAGPRAVLSHLSAAALWGMLAADPAVVHVSCRARRSSRDGIRVHHAGDLTRGDVRVERAVPVTSPARTFLDIAAMVGERRLRGALRVAERERLFAGPGLLSSLPRRRGRPGVAAARRMLERYAGIAGRFRSGPEMDFWELLQTDRRRPLPEVNVHVGGYEADFLWRELKLIVEIDGDPWHRTAVDRAHDAERDRVHRALGYTVLRYSDEDVADRPAEILASLDLRLEID